MKQRTNRWEFAIALAVSVAVGLLALAAGDLPMRWFVAFLGATFLLPAALLFYNAHTFQLTAIILALQAYMCITLLPGEGSGAAGRGLEVHLTTLLCLVALTARWSEITARGLKIKGPLFAPFVAVIATTTFSVLVNHEHKAGVIFLANELQYFLVYVTVINLVTDRRYARIALAAIFLTTTTEACVYFFQYFTHKTFTLMGDVVDHSGDLLQRHGGLVGTHPSALAEFMNLMTLPSVALFLAAPPSRFRRRAAVAAVLGSMAILLTLTRAAWIGFVLGAIVLVAISFRRGWLSRTAISAMAGAALVMVIIFIGPITGVFMKEHEDDFDERYVLQLMALRVIEARPILGVGVGAYPMTFKNYAVSRDFDGYWAFTVHNHYMLRAAEAGIQGLIVMLWLFWRCWLLAWRATLLRSPVTSRMGLGVAAGMIAVFFQLYFDVGDASAPHFAFWFLLGMLEALRTLEEQGVVVGFEEG